MSSIQSHRRASQRSSIVTENFKTFSPSKGSASYSRLEQQRRWGGIRESRPVVATALSSSGWVATSTHSEIRLYDLKTVDTSREIKKAISFECCPEREEIRAIALSTDLLAVITRKRLIVYAYKDAGRIDEVYNNYIDRDQDWIPCSVAIRQRGSVKPGLEASAWIAVGGQGKNGVKLFKYSYRAGWSASSDRLILTCPGNTTSIGLVGFSTEPVSATDNIIVFSVTLSNRIYCWSLSQQERGHGTIRPNWQFSLGSGRQETSRREDITSAAVFYSPSRRPYIFCAVDQKSGSRVFRSCTLALDSTRLQLDQEDPQWRELPEHIVSRNVLCGTVTSNGHFIVIVEAGWLRLLMLEGAYDGGLTCLRRPLEWTSPLELVATGVSALSVLIEESNERLHITAVDGRGHIMFATASVKDMPAPEHPRREQPQLLELGTQQAAVGELSSFGISSYGLSSSGESSRYSGSMTIKEQAEDRIELVSS